MFKRSCVRRSRRRERRVRSLCAATARAAPRPRRRSRTGRPRPPPPAWPRRRAELTGSRVHASSARAPPPAARRSGDDASDDLAAACFRTRGRSFAPTSARRHLGGDTTKYRPRSRQHLCRGDPQLPGKESRALGTSQSHRQWSRRAPPPRRTGVAHRRIRGRRGGVENPVLESTRTVEFHRPPYRTGRLDRAVGPPRRREVATASFAATSVPVGTRRTETEAPRRARGERSRRGRCSAPRRHQCRRRLRQRRQPPAPAARPQFSVPRPCTARAMGERAGVQRRRSRPDACANSRAPCSIRTRCARRPSRRARAGQLGGGVFSFSFSPGSAAICAREIRIGERRVA